MLSWICLVADVLRIVHDCTMGFITIKKRHHLLGEDGKSKECIVAFCRKIQVIRVSLAAKPPPALGSLEMWIELLDTTTAAEVPVTRFDMGNS